MVIAGQNNDFVSDNFHNIGNEMYFYINLYEMVVSEITLYNVLKIKLGEQEAQTVVEGIKQEVRNEFENKKDTLATKSDIIGLKEEMLNLKIDMERGFRDNLKWTVATIIGCTGILLTIIKFIH